MNTQTTGLKSAISAFFDRRALIMLFLGFSSGIPIFLIFATLSFWLSEAGIARSTITMFSWAALAYAFKFIWAPLIDKLPLPWLTKKMGRRRSWLLVSQILVITAICSMAFINPLPHLHNFGSLSNLTLMAMAAVFLGFSSATQDIIVDAYRIELTQDANLQTVLASTYNAGYRSATIITQLGGLLFAASMGTAMGNYIYEAWKTTYLLMACLMLVGVATTLLIHEPEVDRPKNNYKTTDYLQLFIVFVLSTAIFIKVFIELGPLFELLTVSDAILNFLLEALRFISSAAAAVVSILILIKLRVFNRDIIVDTWIAPLADFFKRYGLKVALAILLLIGFYRISDIVAGVMANLFYLDLNFDKEEIAWFNKLFAVLFVILGGFIGGVLSQRYNIMKMMLLGAALASTTNLIFVGLVKSGASMNEVQVSIGAEQYKVQPDEVGNWTLDVPKKVFAQAQQIDVNSQPAQFDRALTLTVPIDHFQSTDPAQLYIQAIGGNNHLYQDQLKKDVIIHGSLANLPKTAQATEIKVKLVGTAPIEAKIDDANWSAVIPGAALAKHNRLDIEASYQLNNQKHVLVRSQSYVTDLKQVQPKQRLTMADVSAVNYTEQGDVSLKGKVVVPYSKVWLVMGIIFDNMASGLAGAVFIAFLSSLTSVSFTAMQYALFSSLMLLLPKTIAGYSGTIVTNFGYSKFFFITFLMGIPILFLVTWVARLLANRE